MSAFHIPALLKEVIRELQIKKGEKYIDATVGGGGHAFEILRLGGKVLGIDVDQEAISYVTRHSVTEENLVLVHANFKNIEEIAHTHGFTDVAGILFDLGVSSHQLEKGERGFSFRHEGILDMRMDPSGSEAMVTAKDLINGLTKKELYELFTKLGQEERARAIADRIVSARKVKPIETTEELATLVMDVYGGKKVHGIHPGTKVFQALRIAVNDELYNLSLVLPVGLRLLKSGGRMVVISFHSLEDRIVKRTFQTFAKQQMAEVITRKPIRPTTEEQQQNPRGRSAKMRVVQKI